MRSSRGYCPELMYVWLFMLQASLSEWRQIPVTGPLRSHSHSPLTLALFGCKAKLKCGRVTEGECVCLHVLTSNAKSVVVGLLFTQGGS